ncbi:MAG: type 4a pilus biogenesis protein PilO [Candidatus Acidiferrales bacterium]
MATPYREWPWILQLLLAVVLLAALVLAGLYVPGSPVRNRRTELADAQVTEKSLASEVSNLRDFERQRGQLQGEMEALEKQLATLQTIVPEDKQVDQFILMVQSAAATSGVEIRHLVTKPIVAKDYHYEMPFEIDADGPYYAMMDFFGRLGRLSRIINVGDLTLNGASQLKYHSVSPNTTIAGNFTIITFFTKLEEPPPAARAVPSSGR